MIPGIDVSNHQALIDWDQVKGAGVEFAICKASEGMTFTDAWFAHNWRSLEQLGMVRGAYHFARPSLGAPEPQAEHFLSILRNSGGMRRGDLLVLDIEDQDVGPNAGLRDWCLTWLRYVEAAVGFKPLLYSGRWYMQPHGMIGEAALAEYGLWLAAYQNDMPSPPPLWPVLALWQYTSSGSVPGVAGPCDLNWFNGEDVGQLRLYGLQQAEWPQVPVPTPVLVVIARIEADLAELRRLVGGGA